MEKFPHCLLSLLLLTAVTEQQKQESLPML